MLDQRSLGAVVDPKRLTVTLGLSQKLWLVLNQLPRIEPADQPQGLLVKDMSQPIYSPNPRETTAEGLTRARFRAMEVGGGHSS